MDATILEAIPGANPSGASLRYEAIYGEIRARVRSARGEVVHDSDDPNFHGTDVEWRFVIGACRDLLRRRSKDLMLAAWLTEAQLAVDGLTGLRDGLDVLCGLLEVFWETLYPEMEDGDAEARVRIFEWLDVKLAEAVPSHSVSGTFRDSMTEMIRRHHNRELDACVESLSALEAVWLEKFGEGAPLFAALRDALLGMMTADADLAAIVYPLGLEDLQLDDLPRVPAPPRGGGASQFPAPPAPVPVYPPAVSSKDDFTKLFSQEPKVRPVAPSSAPPSSDAPSLPTAAPKDRAKTWKYHAEAESLGGVLHLPEGSQTGSDAGAAQASPSGSAVVATNTQKVEFTLTAPEAVAPKVPFEIFVWAHESQERSKVLARAREELNVRDLLARTKGPFKVASGTMLSVRLVIPGAVIDEAEDVMVWEGESTCVSFVVTLPDASRETRWAGSAQIYANGVRVARVSFVLSAEGVAEAAGVRYKKAFASYASDDRDAVLGRIQGIHKVAPEMEIFLDVVSLRSGQNWERELWRVIPASDIFYLFWSSHARKSEWVEKEWRCALRERGIEFIDPIPLEPPQESPPPVELSSLHFNDWELAFRRGKPSANRH